MLFEQRAVDPRLDPEHELLALAFGFDCLGRELGDVGNERDLGRDHEVGRGIEHDANVCAHRHPPRHRFGQEEGHVDVAEIDEVEHAAAAGDDLTGLSDAILNASSSWCAQIAVTDVGIDPFDRRLHRIDIGARANDLAARRTDRGIDGGKLGPGRFDCGGRALYLRLIVVALLHGGRAFACQRLGAPEAFARRIKLSLALAHAGKSCCALAPPLRHLALRGLDSVEGLGELRLRFGSLGIEDIDIHVRNHLTRFDEITLIGNDGADTAGRLCRNVNLDRLDAAVAANDPLGQTRWLEHLPEQQADGDHRHEDAAPDDPCFLRGRHWSWFPI